MPNLGRRPFWTGFGSWVLGFGGSSFEIHCRVDFFGFLVSKCTAASVVYFLGFKGELLEDELDDKTAGFFTGKMLGFFLGKLSLSLE